MKDMHLLRYFKGHIGAVALVLLLLMVQAASDLALPGLTSQIVDVGIQQSGVESVATDGMSADTYEKLLSLTDEKDSALLEKSYSSTDDGNYLLNEFGREHRSEIEAIIAKPLIAIHSQDSEDANSGANGRTSGSDAPIRSFSEMYSAYESGMIDREEAIAEVDRIATQGSPTDEMQQQVALAAARAEYEKAGYELSDIQMGFLARTGALMLGLAALGMIMSILIGLIASRTGAKIGFSLRSKLFSKVVSFSESEVSEFSAASLITRGTNDIQLIQNISVMLLRMILSAPILAIGGIIMVMVTNASMGWIIVVAIIGVFALVGIVFKVAMPKFKIVQKLIDKVNLISREMLNGMPVIRAFDRQSYEEERFDGASEHLMRTQLFTNRVMAFMMPTMFLIMNVTSVAIVWFGAGYIDAGTLQTGDLIAFITYAMVIIMSFLMLGMVSIMLPRAEVAAERVDEVIAAIPAVTDKDASITSINDATLDTSVLDDESADDHDDSIRSDESQKADKGVSISFKDVSFAYSGSNESVLEDISFDVKAGETLAIVGATGSGKSSIIKLIERFYDVNRGSITMNGIDIRDLSQNKLRAMIGYVPQKAFLFQGTIKTNVAYSDPDMDEERIETALSCAQAIDFVNDMEDGVDTEISQGGTNVSGGQRQRLAIARALATNSPIMLFDDSFSALDYKTDAALRRAMGETIGDVTQIIVAQRISTVLDADRILVLDEGRIAGIGTHEELLANCEEYREIALSQLSPTELEGVSR